MLCAPPPRPRQGWAPSGWAGLSQSCTACDLWLFPAHLPPCLSPLTRVQAIPQSEDSSCCCPFSPYHSRARPLTSLLWFPVSFGVCFLEDCHSNPKCSPTKCKKRPQTSGALEPVHTAHWLMGATWVPHLASLCSVTSLGGLKSAVADVLAPQKAANAPDQEHFPLGAPVVRRFLEHHLLQCRSSRVLTNSGPQMTFPFSKVVAIWSGYTRPLVIHLSLIFLLMAAKTPVALHPKSSSRKPLSPPARRWRLPVRVLLIVPACSKFSRSRQHSVIL